MIKFFRKIRYNLIEKNNTGKYLKYAIGEILLVVIGILIALQINNWNEGRKDARLANQYLKGIKSDLNNDINQINLILKEQMISINLINSIDSIFNKEIHQPDKYQHLYNKPDTSSVVQLFHRGLSFRSIRGTYNSLISDGKSGLIKNRTLYEEVQQIYDERHQRLTSIYETLKTRDNEINWAYPFEKKHWNYSDLKKSTNEKIFLDLSNFTETKYFYSQHLLDVKEETQKVINLIDIELDD